MEVLLIYSHYDEFKKLLRLAESNTDKFMIIFINGNCDNTDANSGYLEYKETVELEDGFSHISTHYKYYEDPSLFVGDIILNKIPLWKERYIFLYSVAQIGVDVNRRSFIPNFAQLHNIFTLTCDGYHLSLMQNKFHYYELNKTKVNVPETYLYTGRSQEIFENLKNKRYVLKPNLECSARGVRFIDSGKDDIKKHTINLHEEFNQPILIQEFIEGVEIEVPVIVNNGIPLALPPIKIVKDNIGLTEEVIAQEKYHFEVLNNEYNWAGIQKSAETVIDTLEGSGLCRVDFIVDSTGEVWLFDVAAIPLISKHSSCYTSFKYLFPEDDYAIYKAILGAKMAELI